ncbi:MAG: peptide/nickel transport system ATP-binding protein [Actinomycetota bacterium]|nr:peptide/nickel transport system ATP-binding protein [Actinomycetota bacterium]
MQTVRRLVSTAAGAIGLAILAVLAAIAVAAPSQLGDTAGHVAVADAYQGMSRDHLFGTDALGRDIFSRVLVATRLSLLLALGATALGALIGLPLGAATAVLPRRVRGPILRLINIGMAFPGLLIALFMAAVLGPGVAAAVSAIGLASAPGFARLAQTLAASVAGTEYVAAARVVGVSRRRLLARHVLPNIAEPLIVTVALVLSSALLAVSALSFLGLGVQPPTYDWGRLLGDGLPSVYVSASAALAPGAAIVIAGVSFGLLGEAFTRLTGAAAGRSNRRRRQKAAPSVDSAERPRAGVREAVLELAGLTVTVTQARERFVAVDDVDIAIGRGERVGVVGESGSGKTLTALAIARLLPTGVEATERSATYFGARVDEAQGQPSFAARLTMVFQDPMSSLNPALRIGTQLTEVRTVHQGRSRASARAEALRWLERMQIPAPELRMRQFPHELSGGTRQRVMAAMALLPGPLLLVADEPTTALDVTVQAQLLEILRAASTADGTALLFISHDIAVVSSLCERVLVMYAGRVVESAATTALAAAAHPYTRALVASVPQLDDDPEQDLAGIPGSPPPLGAATPGCAFAPRCLRAQNNCHENVPALMEIRPGHLAACWYPVMPNEP